MDPESFSSQFDLIQELAVNREEYVSDEVQCTIRRFSSDLSLLIDQCREQVPMGIGNYSRPGKNATIVCCISNGLNTLSKNEDIKELIRLKRKLVSILDPDKNQDAALVKSLWDIFSKFQVDSLMGSLSHSDRQGLYLSTRLKQTIYSTVSELGINFDSLSSVCIQITLCEQDWVLPEMREGMEKCVNQFLRLGKTRRRIFEILLGELDG